MAVFIFLRLYILMIIISPAVFLYLWLYTILTQAAPHACKLMRCKLRGEGDRLISLQGGHANLQGHHVI